MYLSFFIFLKILMHTVFRKIYFFVYMCNLLHYNSQFAVNGFKEPIFNQQLKGQTPV